MGTPVVTVGNKHVCPMTDGLKPHVGGTVTEGINGVLVDGKPIAVKGSKCICTGSPKPNSINMGSPGVFVDGQQMAIVGSMTEHGGVVIEGIPGVTVSRNVPLQVGVKEEPEPRIFNIQWRNESSIIKYGEVKQQVILSADTVGYEDGEKVELKIYKNGQEENPDIVEGVVNDGRVEIEWLIK